MLSKFRRRVTLPSLFAVATSLCLVGTTATTAGAAPSDRGQKANGSFRGRFAFGRAESLLSSDVLSDRVRALERLGSTNSPRAVERLIRALEPGSGAATAEERLTAVRELRHYTDDPGVRRALARVLGGHAASSEQPGPLDDLAQATAALALSLAGTPDAFAALGKALSGGGSAANAAKEALVAHPPRKLGWLLGAAVIPTEELAEALSALGDQRAFDPLRTLIRNGSPEVRARAAVGLTELGDFETVALARLWTRAGNPNVLRAAAARILALAHSSDAASAVQSLLEDDATWQAGLEVALFTPSPALVPALSRRFSGADPDAVEKLAKALGRAGGSSAVNALERELSDARARQAAADALARMPEDGASAALERALSRRETRRLAAVALGVRHLVGRTVPVSLAAALRALEKSRDRDDRVASALCRAMLDPRSIGAYLRATDSQIVSAVASLVFLSRSDAPTIALRSLAVATDVDAKTALAVALLREENETQIPTGALLSLIDDKTSAAPLAARALSARDEAATRPTVDAMLASADPLIRLHTALGLGRSPQSDASGRLAAAYRFESDENVRFAIVRSVAHRGVQTSRRTLELAAALDPDARARSAARLALAGAEVALADRGTEVLFFASPEDRQPARRIVAVTTPTGALVPVVAGPDGMVVVAGLPPGSRVLVAAGDERGKDEDRGESGDQKDDRIPGDE
jgi:HEAT repeat protein